MHWEEPCISDSSRQNPWPHQDKEKRGWFLGTMHKITFLCRLPSSVAALMLLVFESSASRSVVSDSLGPHELYSLWNSPGQNTGVGSHSFLQGIFPTQRLNPGLLHCRQILYQLSHQGSPGILVWVAYPFSRGSSWLRSLTLQVDSLPFEPPGKSKNSGVSSLSLLQGIFLTRGLLHCRWILYQLSYQGSPKNYDKPWISYNKKDN